MKKFIFIQLMVFMFACKHEDVSDKAIIYVRKVTDTMVILNKWQVLGPFSSNNLEHFIDEDNLQLFGFKESCITFQDFIKITPKAAKNSSKLDSCFKSGFVLSGKIPLDFVKTLNVSKEKFTGNVYCACNIKCTKNITTKLHFASTTGEKIWLNGKLICSVDFFKYLTAYEQFITIELKKGDNFLLIKVNKLKNYDWDMYARLENFSEKGLERQLNFFYNFSLLDKRILTETDSISTNKFYPSCNGKVIISDNSGNILLTDSIFGGKHWSRSISAFKQGSYWAKVKVGKYTIAQDFYKGDVKDSTKKIINALLVLKTTDKIKNNIDALIFRFNHLLKNTWPGDPKFVTLFTQLGKFYQSLKNDVDPYHHTSGSFIRSYISDIDNSKQYYILHVPSSYRKNNPIPLMTVMPVAVGKLPYLESFRVANAGLSERFQDLAEKYNMIVAEFGSRRLDKPNFNTIEESELFNIIKDIKTDYHIDSKRYYLTGACVGGNDALKMAVKYPDRFAALGVISPEINYTSDNTNSWLQRNETVSFIKNVINTPVLDIHCSIDRHVPVAVSDLLDQVAKKNDLKYFSYKRVSTEYTMYYADYYFDDVFDFCRKYTLNNSPEEIDFTTSLMLYNKSFWVTLNEISSPTKAHMYAKIKGNTLYVQKENIMGYAIDLKTLPYQRDKIFKIIDTGTEVFKGIPNDTILYVGPKQNEKKITKNNLIAGPFAHLFASKFIVIKGTSGSLPEKKGLSDLADTVNKYWYQRYFTSCKIKNDIEVTEKDIAEANLILLGNYDSNTILSKLKDILPVKITKTGIQTDKKMTNGDRLCFYMIYPNPLNRTKYVAIIGYNNPNNISLGSETGSFDDVSNYGWYDYKVWKADNTNEAILLGYFKQNWELFP
jgi:hypothetical protein